MSLFDLFKAKPIPNYSNVENEGLRAISTRFRGSKEDTVLVMTSRICIREIVRKKKHGMNAS